MNEIELMTGEELVRSRLPAFVQVMSTLKAFTSDSTPVMALTLGTALTILYELITDMGITDEEYDAAVHQLNAEHAAIQYLKKG